MRHYSLRLYLLACLLLSLLIAWVSLAERDDSFAVGFPSGESRPIGFIAEGTLAHTVDRVIRHAQTDKSVRLVIDIKFEHDRVLLTSLKTCTERIEYKNHAEGNSLELIDPVFVEEFVRSRLEQANGSSCVESVTVKSITDCTNSGDAIPNTAPSDPKANTKTLGADMQ